MERRSFLSTAALGAGALGSGAVWLPGCGGATVRPTAIGAQQTNELLARLERGVRGVREARLDPVAAAQPWALRPDAGEHTLRMGLEALVVADVARSIPAGAQLPGELAQRLDEVLPILDQCAVTYHALLERTPPAVRRNVDQRFREAPATAMDLAEIIDGRASAIGVSAESRMRLRGIATNVGTRIRRQSANALIDDTTSKIATIVARSGSDVRLARSTTTTAMINAIWQQVEGVPQGGGGGAAATGSPVSQGVYVAEETLEVPEPQESPGDSELMIGGGLLGGGLACFGIGGIITAVTADIWPIVIAATPGGILVIIGIILLIIGAVQNARG